MISVRDIRNSDICPSNSLGNDLGISEGDLRYLRDNGCIDGCIVDDDKFWRLDEDGNWPEAI